MVRKRELIILVCVVLILGVVREPGAAYFVFNKKANTRLEMGVACCEAESDLRPINGDATRELGAIGKPQPIIVQYFGGFYGRAGIWIQMLEHKKADYRFQEIT